MPFRQIRIISFLLITFLYSCHSVDILKRKYSNGFYINLIDKKSSYCENTSPIVIKKNNTFKETSYSEKCSMTKNVSEILPVGSDLKTIDSTAAEKNNKIKLDYNFISVPPDTTDNGQQNYFNEVFDSLPDHGLISIIIGISGIFLSLWPYVSIFYAIVGIWLGVRKLKKDKIAAQKKRDEYEAELLKGNVSENIFEDRKVDYKAVWGVILSGLAFLTSLTMLYLYIYFMFFW